jgi:threonine/homoserine/homoserine lactone efflux protein
MALDLGVLLTALSFGVAYAAAPGAVNAESLRRGLARGFRPALLVQIGSLVGDLGWAALALAGVSLLVQSRPLQVVLGIAGGCFLLRLAWKAFAQAWRVRSVRPGDARDDRGDFATGLFFSIANPFGLAFWSAVGGGLGALGVEGMAGYSMFLGGFATGAIAWCLVAALAIAWTQRRVSARVVRVTSALAGVLLGYFGIRLVWETASAAAN